MTGYAIQRLPTAFAAPRQKRPRQKVDGHLKFLRQLPCVIPDCKSRDIHAAHIRAANPRLGKRETGLQEKPSDAWCLPVCAEHHAEQHSGSELEFWARHGIDCFTLALALWRVSGDEEAALLIIQETREQTK